ncbi:MAG: tetratricopeptide repeat protein [Gammaproteobacteria bacterium]|jgi:tetratricopeptide (TPR) repeat protein|nr:tetratricopeptide repeat protein [Gammaproteobacteria bacterium]|tara:strand:+ start:198 stop:746 length:549 start_codon:yes stop_codon:yes gene_type:complete
MRLISLLLGVAILMPGQSRADQTDTRLDPLFTNLLVSGDLSTIRATENQIWAIWLQHTNSDVEQLMQMGIQRMNFQRYSDALLIFNQIIENFPDYAEAWNKRATLHFLLGNFDESIADIEKTLELEPRHFGALSGLGLMYIQRDELSKARQAFENLIGVHSNSPNAQQNLESVVESLRLNVI